MPKEIYKRFTSLLHNIYIYNYLIINILYIYYIVFVNCKSCKRKKLIKSFFTFFDSNGFETAFTIYNLQKFGALKYFNIFAKQCQNVHHKKEPTTNG